MSKMQGGGVAFAALLLCLFVLNLDVAALGTAARLADVYVGTSAPLGYDPLTEQEAAAVAQAALDSAAARAAGAQTAPPELLLVERHDGGKAAAA